MRTALTFLVCAAFPFVGLLASIAQEPPMEGVRLRTLSAMDQHWLFIMAPFSGGTGEVTNVTVVDGVAMQVLGQLTGGVASAFVVSPDHRQIYMADTYYSRGARGDRTDVLSIYDARLLAPTAEVVLPPKRQLALPDSSSMAVTTDGRFVVVANLTPASSATIIDVGKHRVVDEIQLPGCAEILVSGPREFESICSDGSMMITRLSDDGKVGMQRRADKPFFDIEKDPVFGVPAKIANEAYFISYHGTVYPIDLTGGRMQPGATWSLLNENDKRNGWRPGGWEPIYGQPQSQRLYILMHRGGEWSHKDPGSEVWVFSVKTRTRIDRIALPRMANSILVSQDTAPILFALTTSPATLQEFSATTGRYLGAIEGLAGLPVELFGP